MGAYGELESLKNQRPNKEPRIHVSVEGSSEDFWRSPRGPGHWQSLSLLFRFISTLVLSSFTFHSSNIHCGEFFSFSCSFSAWKANFSFSTCRVFCMIAIASLGCWGEVFHLSLLACLAGLSPGWGTSLKNQHLSGWVTNCFILVNGQDEMGQWGGVGAWDGRFCCVVGEGGLWHWFALAPCTELLARHGWQASLSPCSDYGGAFLWAEEVAPFWRCLQENPVNSWAWRENVISAKQQGKIKSKHFALKLQSKLFLKTYLNET